MSHADFYIIKSYYSLFLYWEVQIYADMEPEYLPLLNFDIGKKLSFSRCRVCDITTKDLQKGV